MTTPADEAPEPAAETLPGPFPVVGVGASAGGLEAFTRLLRSLPPRPGLALLLVQHLDPTRDSLLTEILARETALTVLEAADGEPVEPDHVYVLPPDTLMGVAAGVIRLVPRGDRAAVNMPVDYLFRSLAAGYGGRAVGVVLSGGGTDGTLGLGAIRDAGGVTFVQDEASAGQPGMPGSAAAGGNADAVLPPELIAAWLARLVGRTDLLGPPPGDADEPSVGESLAPLFALLRSRTGVDFTHYKQNTIRRRVQRRLAVRGFTTADELVRAARDEPAELAAVFRDLLIGVTRFFREAEAFESLQLTAVPALLRDRPKDAALRVWVPGCSTGEEAYSLAITLIEALGEKDADTPVKILATDVNEESLARARAGVYPEGIAADVSPERLRKFFRKADGGYRINPAVRDLCVFARHDLTADPPFARMDLISCRNVLIYFDAVLQRRVLPLFHYALRPGGFLLLGPSESVGPFADLFAPVDRDGRLFTRTLAPHRPLAAPDPGLGWGRTVPGPGVVGSPPADPGGLSDFIREADRVLARYAPAGVLVDDTLHVLQFRGDTGPYLRNPAGAATLELLRMTREGLLADLRDGIAAARQSGTPVRRPGVRVGDGDSPRAVALQIVPLSGGGPTPRGFLVLFEDDAAAGPVPPPAPATAPDAESLAERVTQLRRELDASREHQQAVAEEYEAANEELKSANEEILASNEELQSTNEELQTAKEEMQSANEELETVNEELEHRNRELGRANDDLRSLLVGVNVPVVVVGRDLRVRRLTAQAEAVFGLLPTDTGRPLRDLRVGLDGPDLGDTVGRVIETLEAAAFEARDRAGRWYSVRVRPYETGDNRIDGAVVTAIDVDALKRAEAARRDLEARMFHAQKLESLGVMAGGIAHDLNNLLTPVLGYAELAREAVPPTSKAVPLLDELSRAMRIAADLVHQVHAYSGKTRREVRSADLSGLVRGFGGLLDRAVGKRADLRYDLAPAPLPVDADAAQISQVVLNLVTNAAEAAGDRGGTVTVRTTTVAADRAALASPYLDADDLPEGDYAVLEVSDTGAGMTADTLVKLFDPFYTTKFTGRGLGLAAVLGIVRGHRGTIRVQSELGRGSTFRVLLPLVHRPPPAPATPTAPRTEWRGSGTLLVVDDDDPIRAILSTLLTGAGFTVLAAADGPAGIETFRTHAAEIRAVVLDLTMPGVGGEEVAAVLRAARPDLPILVTSGYSRADLGDRFNTPRIDGFVRKPFTPTTLLAALRDLLERSAKAE